MSSVSGCNTYNFCQNASGRKTIRDMHVTGHMANRWDANSTMGSIQDDPGYATQDDAASGFHFPVPTGLPPHYEAAMPELNALKDEVRFLETIFRRWPCEQSRRLRAEIMKTYLDTLYDKLQLGPRRAGPLHNPLNDLPENQPNGAGVPISFPVEIPNDLRDRLSRTAASTIMDMLSGGVPGMRAPVTPQAMPTDPFPGLNMPYMPQPQPPPVIPYPPGVNPFAGHVPGPVDQLPANQVHRPGPEHTEWGPRAQLPATDRPPSERPAWDDGW